MSALQKLKAYFGMVPAEDDYDFDEDYRRGYSDDYDGYDDREYAEPQPRRSRPRYHVMEEFDEPEPAPVRTRRPVTASEPSVHGALAMDRQPDPVSRLRAAPEPSFSAARDPLSRIITLHPTSYAEAREIGEAYRDGAPVIMNLTEMENADAKRLVDFAAGLAFALRGSMDKVTNKVFLLSPPDVDVTAEDRRRIAEGGLFLRN
ncbi:cell division protein SepF [Prauserella muralis]|uniref:Cell division protein SepF n=1 Tax=Prauserella muralis TaxID=588067 RepID=A0A2V4AHV2_9PSEU|nr:cell division protein SepF [Prauserella muralis]PXY19514.1 cell division protein SepF [Prauserella muralis]TWE29499.1 cell division inhibitor SepF [Prauserella muralis]